MWPKTGLTTEMLDGFKIQCVLTHQWLKSHLPNLTRFMLIPYLQDHILYKQDGPQVLRESDQIMGHSGL